MTDRAARCETCCYFVEEHGECRANPPQVVVTGEGEVCSYWPIVLDEDYCGHYRPNAAALAALVEAQP